MITEGSVKSSFKLYVYPEIDRSLEKITILKELSTYFVKTKNPGGSVVVSTEVIVPEAVF